MDTYLFYDIETSGLSPAFDQVLTFACIRTDAVLNEVARETITVRLRPDIVPSPHAFLTHCLTPDELEKGICEYEAARKIHALMNTPGTISCGYNSLGFDDEFLRFLFYRNLLDPYSHQYANGCSRMDMLPVATAFRLFHPSGLAWPVLADGTPSMKLEHLSSENGFEVSGRAHEAMADVEALLCLSRSLSAHAKIWTYLLGFFDKTEDMRRAGRLGGNISVGGRQLSLGLMVSVSFGAKRNYLAPVIHLGGSDPYKNQSLWLRTDRDGLFDKMDDENGIYDVFVIRKRPGDQFFLLPCLERFWKRLAPEAVAIHEKNLARITEAPDIFLETAGYHRAFSYPVIPDLDPDASLYQDGFFSRGEKADMSQFHQLATGEKYKVYESFESRRIRTMARRILDRNFNDKNQGKSAELLTHMAGLAGDTDTAVKGYKSDSKYTCQQALEALSEIEAGGTTHLTPVQKSILAWLAHYIPGLLSSLTDSL